MELALQYKYNNLLKNSVLSHNPCFYGISFAMSEDEYNGLVLD